jgi:hypothetical protein
MPRSMQSRAAQGGGGLEDDKAGSCWCRPGCGAGPTAGGGRACRGRSAPGCGRRPAGPPSGDPQHRREAGGEPRRKGRGPRGRRRKRPCVRVPVAVRNSDGMCPSSVTPRTKTRDALLARPSLCRVASCPRHQTCPGRAQSEITQGERLNPYNTEAVYSVCPQGAPN